MNIDSLEGNFALIKFLSKDIGRNEFLCQAVAKSGKVQILKWLRIFSKKYKSSFSSWSESICANAAEYGHFELLKWLRTPNQKYGTPCPWNEWTCDEVIKGRFLEILKWLRTPSEKYGTPCPWDRFSYNYAKTVKIKQWLIENNCPRE